MSAPVRKIMFVAIAATMLGQCNVQAPAANDWITPTALSELTGAWDIVSFDGYRPARLDTDGQRHAFVDIRGDDVSFSIECNYTGLEARIDRGQLVAVSNDNVQTQMACGAERERRDAAFFAFLRGSPSITMNAEHGLRLERGDVRLELQRPQVRRRHLLPVRQSEFEGAWRAEILYWRVEPGRSDNLLADLGGAPARFTFSPGLVRLAFDCETVTAPVELSDP
jgi:heat shock protein HslJ